MAVIKVGAATETEMKEKKYSVEDALNATRSALQNAASVSAMLQTTESSVAEKPEKKKTAPMQAPDMD